MKNILLAVFFSVVLINLSLAQERKFLAGASFNIQIPQGDFSDYAKTGTGFYLNGEYMFNKSISAIITTGYHSSNAKLKTIGVGGVAIDFNVKSIDVFGGFRYYMNESFFGIVELGSRFYKLNASIWEAAGGSNHSKESTDYNAYFSANFGLGYRIRLAERSTFDLSGVYHLVNVQEANFSVITLRAALMVFF